MDIVMMILASSIKSSNNYPANICFFYLTSPLPPLTCCGKWAHPLYRNPFVECVCNQITLARHVQPKDGVCNFDRRMCPSILMASLTSGISFDCLPPHCLTRRNTVASTPERGECLRWSSCKCVSVFDGSGWPWMMLRHSNERCVLKGEERGGMRGRTKQLVSQCVLDWGFLYGKELQLFLLLDAWCK